MESPVHHERDNKVLAESPPQANDTNLKQTEAPIMIPAETTPSKYACLYPYLGPFLVFLTGFAFTVNQYVFKLIAQVYQSTCHELLLLRGIHSVIVSAVAMLINRQSPFDFKGMEAKWIVVRTIMTVLNNLFYFMGLIYLPVSLASVIFCTLPVIVAILARIFLEELFKAIEIVCIFVNIIGLVMIFQQPAAIFGGSDDTGTTFGLSVGYILIADLCFAINGLASRKIKGGVEFFLANLYYGIFMAMLEGYIIYFSTIPTEITILKFIVIMAGHTCALIGQGAYYYAHMHVMAITGSYYVFIQAFLAFLADAVIIGDSVDYIQIIGAAVIVVASIVLATSKFLQERERRNAGNH